MAPNPKTLAGEKKPALHLLPWAGIMHIVPPLMDGAQKYGPFNWREGDTEIPASIYLSAAMRHILAYLDGEDIDPESSVGTHHLGAAMAALAVYLDAVESGTATDDRPPDSAGLAEMIRFFKEHGHFDV